MPQIVRTSDELSREWLTSVLQGQGILNATESVTLLEIETIGTGQMGCVTRLTPHYSAGKRSAPETFIAKFASTNDTSRQSGIGLGIYEAEVRFYQQISRSVGMRTPQCWFAGFDAEEGWFTLLLEDFGGYEIGDVLQPGTLKKAQLAIGELVKLHISRWDDPGLVALDWLSVPRFERVFAHFPRSLEGFIGLFESSLPPSLIALAERLLPKSLDYIARWQGPKVIQHGDYRLDNMLFGQKPDQTPIVIIDWQTVGLGPPMVDFAYYLGSGLPIEDRRQHEQLLVGKYHQRLMDAGIGNYGWEDCWSDYRLHSLFGFYLVAGMSVLVGHTERSLALFKLSLERHGAHVLDLRAEELL